MKPLQATCYLALIAASTALAQAPNPYNGTWTLRFDGARTADYEGTLVIQDEGGSWKVTAAAPRSNQCIGREAPVSVQLASEDRLVFRVNRSKVLAGCTDWTMKFRKVDDRTLTGEFSSGRPVTLTRQ